jgi:hypothetical protein
MTDKKAIRFKMNEDMLRNLLSGKTVCVDSLNSEDSIEFFLQDIGIDEVENACKEEIEKVKLNLFK